MRQQKKTHVKLWNRPDISGSKKKTGWKKSGFFFDVGCPLRTKSTKQWKNLMELFKTYSSENWKTMGNKILLRRK